jgi:hypothetical protein
VNQDDVILPFVDVCERDLDFALAEEIECNQFFRNGGSMAEVWTGAGSDREVDRCEPCPACLAKV